MVVVGVKLRGSIVYQWNGEEIGKFCCRNVYREPVFVLGSAWKVVEDGGWEGSIVQKGIGSFSYSRGGMENTEILLECFTLTLVLARHSPTLGWLHHAGRFRIVPQFLSGRTMCMLRHRPWENLQCQFLRLKILSVSLRWWAPTVCKGSEPVFIKDVKLYP